MNPLKFVFIILVMLSLQLESQCIIQTDAFTKDLKVESGDYTTIGKFQGSSNSPEGYSLKVKTFSLNGKMGLRFYAVYAGVIVTDPKDAIRIQFATDSILNVYPSHRTVSSSESSRKGSNWFDIINIKLDENQIAQLEKYPIANIRLNNIKYEVSRDQSKVIQEQIMCVRTAK